MAAYLKLMCINDDGAEVVYLSSKIPDEVDRLINGENYLSKVSKNGSGLRTIIKPDNAKKIYDFLCMFEPDPIKAQFFNLRSLLLCKLKKRINNEDFFIEYISG